MCFVVTLQMMKWQPAVETVRNSDGTFDHVHLFDKLRQLDIAENRIANVERDQLLQHTTSFIDEVLIANFAFIVKYWKGKSSTFSQKYDFL